MSNNTTSTTINPSTPTVAAHPVTWFEIHTADPERAKAFYGGVFGWTFDEAMPGYSMISAGEGAPIGGGIADSKGEYPSDAVFNVQVPDVAAAAALVVEHGGSVVTDVQSTPYGLSFAYVANPDGAVFGLWCPPAG